MNKKEQTEALASCKIFEFGGVYECLSEHCCRYAFSFGKTRFCKNPALKREQNPDTSTGQEPPEPQ